MDRISSKQEELAKLKLQLAQVDFDYNAVLHKHIQKLKLYNELKDSALEMIQLIADQRGEKVSVIFEEIGLRDSE